MNSELKAALVEIGSGQRWRRVQRFTIPGRLPGLNEFINAAKGRGFFAGNRMKQEATETCAYAALALRPIDYPVSIKVMWFEPNRRRDIDNVRAGLKFILDGMVKANRLTNDSRRFITRISDEFPVDPRNPRVVVWITPEPYDHI